MPIRLQNLAVLQFPRYSKSNTTRSLAYDAWGRLLSTTGSMSGTLGLHNPLRYRGYVYDRETGLYYLQSRYYNPTICRFISADSIGYLGADGTPVSYNLFAYCGNNPVMYSDHSGYAVDTVFDIASLVTSLLDVLTNPLDPWAWIGFIADFVDLFPFLTGVGESVKAYRLANKVVDGFGDLSQGSKYGIKAYNKLRELLKGTGLQAHHIIEKRLVKHLGINADQMLSVAVTAAEHQKFTNAWRAHFKYGMDYSDLTQADIWDVAQTIYKDYPDLLDAAYKTLFG